MMTGAVLRWGQGARAPSLWLPPDFWSFSVFVTDKDFKWLETINAVHSDKYFCGVGDTKRPRARLPGILGLEPRLDDDDDPEVTPRAQQAAIIFFSAKQRLVFECFLTFNFVLEHSAHSYIFNSVLLEESQIRYKMFKCVNQLFIVIIIRSRRQQRSVASTQSGHDDEPWTIQHECWRVYRHRSAGSMNGAGVLAVAANQDQNGSQFLLMRPVIMRGELACGHRVSPHGRTMSFVSRRWHPEHREGRSGRQLLLLLLRPYPAVKLRHVGFV